MAADSMRGPQVVIRALPICAIASRHWAAVSRSARFLTREQRSPVRSLSTEPSTAAELDVAMLPARPSIRVVVAEDSYLTRLALVHLLEGAASVTVVGQSEHAGAVTEVIDQQRADVLITDIRMPPSG